MVCHIGRCLYGLIRNQRPYYQYTTQKGIWKFSLLITCHCSVCFVNHRGSIFFFFFFLFVSIDNPSLERRVERRGNNERKGQLGANNSCLSEEEIWLRMVEMAVAITTTLLLLLEECCCIFECFVVLLFFVKLLFGRRYKGICLYPPSSLLYDIYKICHAYHCVNVRVV